MEKSKKILYMCLAVIVYCVVFCFMGPEHFKGVEGEEHNVFKRIENRVYFTLTTASTVGYGGITPASTLSRAVASSMMILILLRAFL